MRQVLVQVPRGAGEELVGIARELGASTLTVLEGSGGRGNEVDLLLVTVPNASVGPLIDRAQDLGDAEASVPAVGAFAFEPPAGEPPEELIDVTPRSPYEVVLAGSQSAGSWRGFLTYATLAGVIVWLALFTETIYLLTASMLIAPFAGPAMNTAISLLSGRTGLLRHSLLRYLAGIAVTAATAGVLTLLAGQHVATDLMVAVLTISGAAFLLPLVAGVAGATYLVQSEHSSLISGAAVGILVAASLAPPAGGLGMAVALGRPDLVAHAVFLISLQLVGITASAIAVLWAYGIRPGAHRFGENRPRLAGVGFAVATLATLALVAFQFADAPFLLQGAEKRHAAEAAIEAVEARDEVDVLGVEARVASAEFEGPPRIVLEVGVERRQGGAPSDQLERDLEDHIGAAVRQRLPGVVTHVDLSVFEPPS